MVHQEYLTVGVVHIYKRVGIKHTSIILYTEPVQYDSNIIRQQIVLQSV